MTRVPAHGLESVSSAVIARSALPSASRAAEHLNLKPGRAITDPFTHRISIGRLHFGVGVMHSLSLISASIPVWLPRLNFSNSPHFSDAEQRYALVVAACLIAAVASLLVWIRRRGLGTDSERDLPLATIAPNAGPHEALIGDLLHCARLAHREGIASLVHPLSHSTDSDVAYAMALVASHADPRIVRGVLLDRLVERTSFTSEFERPGLFGRRMLTRGGLVLLIASAACLWQLSRHAHGFSPALAACGFALWCGGGMVWFASSCRLGAGAPRVKQDSVEVRRGMLILIAAELIASGEETPAIERKLREMAGDLSRTSPLASAA